MGRRVDVVNEGCLHPSVLNRVRKKGAAVVKMGPQSDRALLGRIPARIARIEECANRERSKFYGSRLVQDAVVRNSQTIAESTQRVSDGLRATEPDVASRAVAGFAT